MLEQINATLAKFPIKVLVIASLLYLGYNFYFGWLTEPTSSKNSKIEQIKNMKAETEVLKEKVTKQEEFVANLETIKNKIRSLAEQLEESKAILSSEIDIGSFLNMIGGEAKKIGLNLAGTRPMGERQLKFYKEVPFELNFKGAFVQVLVFFDRIAKMQQVLRIADFEMRPTGSATTKYVELVGVVRLNAYSYIGTADDSVAKNLDNPDAYKAKASGDAASPATGTAIPDGSGE